MSELSKNIQTLYATNSWFNRKAKLNALVEIARTGTPYAIGSFFSIVFATNPKLSVETANAIHSLIQKIKPSEWTRLYPSFQYISINKLQLSYLSLFPANIAVDLLGIASLNGDGHIREVAINKLLKIKSSGRIPFILLRLNDWVKQVNQAAFNALEEIIKDEPADLFLKYIYILDWMARAERTNLTLLRNKIINELTKLPDQFLYNATENPDAKVRSFCYDILMRKDPEDVNLIKTGLKDRNPTIRNKIFEYYNQLPVEVRKQYLVYFLSDHSPLVRSKAMMMAGDDQFGRYKDIIYSNVFSNSVLVRSTARYLLKKHRIDNFEDDYRQQLIRQSVTPGIISGLAETGDETDFGLILPFISDPNPRLRSAALAGIYRLESTTSLPFLIDALKDSSSRVRRVTTKLLCKNITCDSNMVRKMLLFDNPQCRIAALDVLTCLLTWESLIDILFVLSDSDSNVRVHAWNKFIHWHHHRSCRNWVKPNTQIIETIEQTISDLNKRHIYVPDSASRQWNDLPSLIDAGRRIWSCKKTASLSTKDIYKPK